MIIKGAASTGKGLADYLLRTDNGQTVELWGVRGDWSRDLKETLEHWRSDRLATACAKPLYHAQINPAPNRPLTRDEWTLAIEEFENALGLQRQPRALVKHEKKQRAHLHLVYSRIDAQGRIISDSWNYLHHERAARAIEQQLGLEITPGPLIDRIGARPQRTLPQRAIQQGDTLKLGATVVQREVLDLYQRTGPTATPFLKALQHADYHLLLGDQCRYVLVDPVGGVHNLAWLLGLTLAELEDVFKDQSWDQETPVRSVQQAQRAKVTRRTVRLQAAQERRALDQETALEQAPAEKRDVHPGLSRTRER